MKQTIRAHEAVAILARKQVRYQYITGDQEATAAAAALYYKDFATRANPTLLREPYWKSHTQHQYGK